MGKCTHEASILSEWTAQQIAILRSDRVDDKELRDNCRAFLQLVRQAVQHGALDDTSGPRWAPAREFLAKLSSDTAFAKSPEQRANFFYLRSPWADSEQNLDPVARAVRAQPESVLQPLR